MVILLSRTDSIGDVILSLPMAGLIKKHYPHCKLIFLGKTYTKEVVECSEFVDEFMNWSEIQPLTNLEKITLFKSKNIDVLVHVFPNKEIAKLAYKAKIKVRIGTAHRAYHLLYCNHTLVFSRKKSKLHEAQLNIKLLKPLNIKQIYDLPSLVPMYGYTKLPMLKDEFKKLLSSKARNIILHTKSKGSAREWGLDNFSQLIKLAHVQGAKIFLTGTEEEGLLFREKLFFDHPNLVDLSGKMSLKDLIAFIAHADTLVAASTGPLHIASAVGIQAVGIFPPIKPMHPGRWAPIGAKTQVFVGPNSQCTDCLQGQSCHCMQSISADVVAAVIFN
jgi:ADP-heptose:LPS heptosyltransferase